MIAAIIFILHLALMIYAFMKYKKEGFGEGFLAVAFIGILFAVGWTIATMLTNLLFAFETFEKWYWQQLDSWLLLLIRKELNRDTISLLILTFFEILFYYFFFLKRPKNTTKTGSPAD